MPKRPPKIVERKLGREGACGQHEFGTRQIEIDPRQSARERLDTVIHEALHYCHPAMSEAAVTETANAISAALWRDRFRRIER
jgi:hypothetical protein